MENAALTTPIPVLTGGNLALGPSCGKRMTPNRYSVSETNNTIHIPKKISRFKIPHPATISALDKNFRARASSKKPNTTFTVVIQPPDLGREFNQVGKRANSPNGRASATPKPVMPAVRFVATLPSPKTVLPNRPPKIGPVQEKETSAKVTAIKKIPIPPPTLVETASIRFAQELGRVSS